MKEEIKKINEMLDMANILFDDGELTPEEYLSMVEGIEKEFEQEARKTPKEKEPNILFRFLGRT